MGAHMNLFENAKIRCLRAGKGGKWYFSVVDVCAAIRGTDYESGRNYWKWLKSKLAKASGQLVSVTNQLKLPAADGKLRYTDVMDAEGVLRLLQQIPSPKAVEFRLWILAQIKAGKNITKQLTRGLVSKSFAREIKKFVINTLGGIVPLKTIYKHEFMLH